MFSAYRPVLTFPKVWPFIIGGILARVGGAMFGVAVIVMLSQRRGSYTIAGAVSAVGIIVLAVAGPVIGRLADKYGQRRASVPFVLLSVTGSLVTVWLSATMAPMWAIFLAYGIASVTPELGPMSRARWVHIFRDRPDRLHSALSFEQVLEELSFVVGPVLAVLLATTWFPEAGVLGGAVLFGVGMLVFLFATTHEPPVTPHAHRPQGLAIRHAGLAPIAVILVMTGIIFGSNEVVAVAVADEAGTPRMSSMILAAFALGSAASAIIFGALAFRISQTRRLLLAALGMFVLEAPALIVGQLWNLWGLVLVMLVAGAATAPMLITAMSLSQHLVPRALLTEALAVAVTGILIGISLGASLGGIAVDHLGAHAAYAVPVGAGLIATLLALIRYRPLSAAERAAVGT
ncbi:MAG TPA: MFS transporter [Intrasporangiaceae bacterium]|nr:MFS transporter [Intrasporangiaceae bacterium]